jgi:uncharacterized protein (TIGR02453 family)
MPITLHPKTFSFLKDLKKHNNKPWFDKHKPLYEEVKNGFVDFMEVIIKDANKFDKSIGEQEAKKVVYRIYRDIRFSKDKTPYKSNLAAGFGRGGRKSKFAGYYMHIQPGGESYIGAGVWHPEAEDVKKIRQEIDYNLADYKKIINRKSFAKQFGEAYDDKQKTVPQGYAADNPAIEILKYRSFLYGCDIDDKTVMSPRFVKEAVRILKELSPYVQFLNKGLE